MELGAGYKELGAGYKELGAGCMELGSKLQDIRRAIYTTNAIESLNSVIRKSTKRRKVFPTDDSATKVIYLAIQEASKKWTMPIRNWKAALNRFMIEFEDRLKDYI